MACQLVQAPLCRGNLNTQCSQIWGPSLVLMGDAAHSMWPTLGQGVNAALEDAAVLNTVLKDCKVGWGLLLDRHLSDKLVSTVLILLLSTVNTLP